MDLTISTKIKNILINRFELETKEKSLKNLQTLNATPKIVFHTEESQSSIF